MVNHFFSHPDFIEVLALYGKSQAEKRKAAFNIFTLSSYNNHRENFHSDILAFLLNSNEAHGQGNTMLISFIQYLVSFHKCSLEVSDFEQAIVSRETARMDIWIRDPRSRKSIIIENKINGAVDQKNQLKDYFRYSVSQNYEVAAVIYLTLNGTKRAPVPEGADFEVLPIAAYSGASDDLVTGWLLGLMKNLTDEDTRSFLNQYIKLLKHIAGEFMDTEAMERFYCFFSTSERLAELDTTIRMRGNLGSYRAERFAKQLINHEPFSKRAKLSDFQWGFEGHKTLANQFKVEVAFYNNGLALLEFWNPSQQDIRGREILEKKLIEIGMLMEFEEGIHRGGNGYKKSFSLNGSYSDIQEIDQSVLNFVNRFFSQLK